MPLPLAHALAGGTIAVAVWPERTPAGLRRALVVGALLGVCPDADYVLGRLHVLGCAFARWAPRNADYFASRRPVQPGPRTTWPGVAPVCSPPRSTCTPLTNTSVTPVANCCGRW
jgi:hypothetical protein